jgi:hypothetical protein
VARALVLIIIVAILAMLSWASLTEDLAIGFVVQLRPASGSTLVEINPLISPHLPALIPTESGVMLWDLVVLAGSNQPLDAGRQLLVANDVRSMPIASLLDTARNLIDSARFDQLHVGAIALICIVLALYARLALRLAGSLVFGGATGILIYALLALNAFAPTPFVPVPDGTEDVFMLLAAVIGSVLAFKAMQDEPLSLGLRIVAALAAYTITSHGIPQIEVEHTLVQAAAVLISILFPAILPVATGILVLHLHPAIDLEPGILALLGASLILLRLIPIWNLGAVGKQGRPQPRIDPEIDGDGEFPIESLLRGGR